MEEDEESMDGEAAAAPSSLRRRRGRRRRTAGRRGPRPASAAAASSWASSSSVLLRRQDDALEEEVESFLTFEWGGDRRSDDDDGGTRKRRRRAYGGGGGSNDAMPSGGVDDGPAPAHPTSLPVLLRLREAGLSRRLARRPLDGNGHRRASWRSLLLQERGPRAASSGETEAVVSNLPRLRVPVRPTSSRSDSLRHSSPTYRAIDNENDDDSNGNNSQQQQQQQQQRDSDLDDNVPRHATSWRPYARRRIPFSKLGTPLSDAVLAVDRWGGHLIAVGGGCGGCGAGEGVGAGGGEGRSHGPRGGATRPHFSIRFYGVPSPDRLRQIERGAAGRGSRARTASPLVQTVPLLFRNPGSAENRNFSAPSSLLGRGAYASPAAETPVQILLSACGSLGVAFLHHSTATAWSNNGNGATSFSESPATQDEDVLGTIVVFEPPPFARGRDMPRMTTSFRCSNVRVGGWNSFTMRNSLWPTAIVPAARQGGRRVDAKENGFRASTSSCRRVRVSLSAYVLFNDEDDGFRIAWITIGDGLDEDEAVRATNSSNNIRPTRNDIVVFSDGASLRRNWEECVSDPETGRRLGDGGAPMASCSGLNVASEAYLRVDALLCDVTSRRRSSLFGKSPYGTPSLVPDFFYNLVSASGVKAVLVVVFSNLEKMMQCNKATPAALGFFVEVNLLDQSYDELNWVQHPACRGASSMRQWCDALALNWRMRERRVGVFCLDAARIGPQLDRWAGGTHERNVDEDLEADRDVDLWSGYVERRNSPLGKGAVAAPKDVSMLSLYPQCDVVTNRAVHNAIPVKRMASRSSPIELIYG